MQHVLRPYFPRLSQTIVQVVAWQRPWMVRYQRLKGPIADATLSPSKGFWSKRMYQRLKGPLDVPPRPTKQHLVR